MCFSSNVSFIAAGILAGTGIFTYKAVKVARLKPLANIPFLFAIQQATEGIIWLTHIDTTSKLLLWAMYLFFGTALVFWPSWLPFSLWYAERNSSRKRILSLFAVFGAVFSAYSFYLLCTYSLTVQVIGHSLSYIIATPYTYEYLRLIAYVVPTVLPLFISTITYAWFLGIALILSLCVSYVIFYATYGSVWCFFAAILSIIIWYSIRQEQTTQK